MNMPDNLLYESIIKDLSYTKSSKIISNSHTEHAKILIRYLLKCSKKNIYILSSSLTKDIYNDSDILEELEYFVKEQKGHIDILLQHPDEFTDNIDIINLVQQYSSSFSIRQVADKDNQIKEHFVVNDSNGYRFCPNKTKHSAVASFNLKKTADNLISQFYTLFARATEFNLSQVIDSNSNKGTVEILAT